MTVSKSRLCTVGAGACKFALYLIGLGFLVQILDNLCYIRPFDRLLYLGSAFVVTFVICRVFRGIVRRAESESDHGTLGYFSATLGEGP